MTASSVSIVEHARQTPVAESFDVVVCGGGPAGIGAALASARAGARTCLVESQGCLGGVWTAGLLAWIIDHGNKSGIMREILDHLERLGARAYVDGAPSNGFDIEAMKELLNGLCLEAGVALRQHHFVVDAVGQAGRITHAIVESKSGREALAAHVFIDCTGDGDLAARAGCSFDLGKPGTGAMQPMSLLALVAGVDREAVRPFQHGVRQLPVEPRERLRQELETAGFSPSYALPTLTWVRDDLFLLMANHAYGVSAIDGRDVSRATIDSRRELHRLVHALRGLGGLWSGLHLVATAAHIGVREGRRIHGRYQVSAEDMITGVRHPDAVCRATFEVDVHSTEKGGHGTGIEPTSIRTQPYDIPLRALIARDVEGLLMAGRCISGDFLAHSSYRVTGNAVAMGEGAGLAAAQAVRTGSLPSQWSVEQSAQVLAALRQDGES